MENLQQENNELRNKNLKLEIQLQEMPRSGSAPVPPSETECLLLRETENRLRAAGDLYLTVSQDLDKLRDVRTFVTLITIIRFLQDLLGV